MRKDLMDVLVCPKCKGDLSLNITEENGNEVVHGSLHCTTCNQTYSIECTIPNLLPPEMRN